MPFGQLPVVGSGGFGTLYDLEDGYCVKIAKDSDGAINGQLQDEAQSLLSLAEQGMPTAYQGMPEWTDDGGEEREAIHQEKIQGILNKELFGTGKFSNQIVPEEKISHLNKTTITRTIEDLQALRDQLDRNYEMFAAWAREQKNNKAQEGDSAPVDSSQIADLILDIQDLQFMISVDGSIRLVDPARVVRGAALMKDRTPKQIANKAPSAAREYNKSVNQRINAMIRKLGRMLG